MLVSIKFKDEWRCFKKGETFKFLPGINVIVGKNGSGKSSLLVALNKDRAALEIEVTKEIETLYFDFEQDNVRTAHTPLYCSRDTMRFHIGAKFSSHGEANLAILNQLIISKNSLFMMDEPDMALHMGACVELLDRLVESENRGNQLLLTIHNPVIIYNTEQVLDMDEKEWVSGKDYVKRFFKL